MLQISENSKIGDTDISSIGSTVTGAIRNLVPYPFTSTVILQPIDVTNTITEYPVINFSSYSIITILVGNSSNSVNLCATMPVTEFMNHDSNSDLIFLMFPNDSTIYAQIKAVRDSFGSIYLGGSGVRVKIIAMK